MPFPKIVDNSMRSELVKCERAAYWKYERGLNSETVEHLHAGLAFAAGTEAARKAFFEFPQCSAEEALGLGLDALSAAYGDYQCREPETKWDAPKTKERMMGALVSYFQKWPLAAEMEPLGIELNLTEEIPVRGPDGEFLTYSVRFDFLGAEEDGTVWVVDDKTTGLYQGRISDAWARLWDLDAGLVGYCWQAQKLLDRRGLGEQVAGAKVRGVGIGVQEYAHLEVTVRFQEWEIERWHSQMLNDFTGWATASSSGAYRYNLGHACVHYKTPCQYAKLCKARDPERLIDGNYRIEFWNPVTRERGMNK